VVVNSATKQTISTENSFESRVAVYTHYPGGRIYNNKSGRKTQAARRFRYAAYRCGKRQREEERREMWW